MSAQDHLIVALDFPSRIAALHMVDLLGHEVLWYKVGLELYLAAGAPVVQELVGRGKRVFLDLKLHDIPNTVAGAVRSAAVTGAGLLTVHAAGGSAMLEAAVQAASLTASLQLLAVTVLTSMDDAQLAATGVPRSAKEQVDFLGRMALAIGVHGLVCSPQETPAMRQAAGDRPLLVVPGIRAANAPADDQRRTATAFQAIRGGASKVVVGRPITQAEHPREAALGFLDEIRNALSR